MPRAASADDPIDDAGDRHISLDGLHPCVADHVGSHRAGRLSDDLRQVDAVHDLLGYGHEVEALQYRVHVHSADDGIYIDPFCDGVQVDALGHRVDIDLGHDGVNVNLTGNRVDVHLSHDCVDVDLAHNGVEIHLTQHAFDVQLSCYRIDVHAVDDRHDVDGRDQGVDVDPLSHEIGEVQAVEHLVDHRRDNGRDEPVDVGVGQYPCSLTALGEGLDHSRGMETFVQQRRVHHQPPDRPDCPCEHTGDRYGGSGRQRCRPHCRL